MMPNNFKKALILLTKLFKDNEVEWTLIGSVSLCLQGMKLKPNDLDFIIQYSEMERVQKILQEYEILKKEKLSNNEGISVVYFIKGVNVEICFEHDYGLYAQYLIANKSKLIKWNGLEIPCMRIEDKSEIYMRLGRERKAKIIKEFLENENKRN